MRVEITPDELAAAPGAPVALHVEVHNTGPVIDGYRVELLGLPGLPFAADPPELSLFPETSGTFVVTVVLPPSFPAGRHAIGVKVSSVVDPDQTAVREARLDVAPVHLATMAVEPLSLTAGRRARYTLALANLGNVPVEAEVRASDSLGTLAFRIEPTTLRVGPGERATATVVAQGRRPFLSGPAAHQLTFAADGGAEPLQAAAAFVQKPLVPRGVLTLLTLALALGAWAAVLLLGVDRIAEVVRENDADVAGAEIVSGSPFEALPGGGGVLGSVSGRVTAVPDAKGATVALIPLPGEGGAAAGSPPTAVTTEASGDFRIEKVVTPGVYQLVFSKTGMGTQSRLVELKLGEELTGADVALVGGSASVSGVVSDAKGPLGAATVTATNGTDVVTTVTSPSSPVGSFALSGLPAPATYAVSVAKEGFGTQTTVVDVVPGQSVAGLQVAVSEGKGSISGTVLSKAGLPVPDVLVTVRPGTAAVPASAARPAAVSRAPLRPADLGPDVVGAALTLATGPVGFFSVGGLPAPGTYTVTFQKDGFLLATAVAALPPDGSETNLSPVLQPVTGVLAGIVAEEVVLAVPCEPLACRLPEVKVTVVDRNGTEVRATTTASSPDERVGRYEIAGLPAGPYTVTFSKEGYTPRTVAVSLVDSEPVRALDVTLRGLAVAISGTAPNCTSVEVQLRDGRPLEPPASAAVRSDGTYRLSRLPTPGEYRVVFRPGGTARSVVELTLDAGETAVEVDGGCLNLLGLP